MPDVLHFDKDLALEKATMVLRKKGYNSATIKDLTRVTGLSESSLYNTFGSKEELFKSALDRYATGIMSHLAPLKRPGSALQALRECWLAMCADAAGENRGQGCMVTNSVVELAPHNAVIRKKLKAIYQEFEDLFDETLKRAQAQGELDSRRDTRALARYLLHSTQGIRVLSKLSPSIDYLNEIAEVTLSVLDQGGVATKERVKKTTEAKR